MIETRQRILELFETLAPAERRELVEQLAERSEEDSTFRTPCAGTGRETR